MYGSRTRRLLNPFADRIAAWAVQARRRGADGLGLHDRNGSRARGRALGHVPGVHGPGAVPRSARFAARAPVALFVGALELYKGVDLLVDAWPSVAEQVPNASLRLIGAGAREDLARTLVERGPNVTWESGLAPEEVADELDAATCLVLPSRREGMGRVVVEAFCRGRAVVGARGGGIEDLVVHGENGLLFPSDDADGLARALVRVLSNRELASGLGFVAKAGSEQWFATPEEYAARVRALVTGDEAR